MFNLDKIKNDLLGFAETKIELLKLELKEELAKAIAKLLILSLSALCVLLALIFLSIAASVKINMLLESNFLGYLIVAFIYLIIVLSFYLFFDQKQIGKNLSSKIHKSIIADEDE